MEAKASILVVDDSPENLQVISAVLKQDYKVKVAINGNAPWHLPPQPSRPT